MIINLKELPFPQARLRFPPPKKGDGGGEITAASYHFLHVIVMSKQLTVISSSVVIEASCMLGDRRLDLHPDSRATPYELSLLLQVFHLWSTFLDFLWKSNVLC